MKSKGKLSAICVLLSIIIMCLLAGFLAACADKTPVTDITLNQTNLTVMQGQTYKLVATVKPKEAANAKITWSVTQSADFVSVSEDGTVTALAVGVAVVTAKHGKISASCNVAVIPLAPTGIELNTRSIVLDKDGSYNLRATIKPQGASGTVAFTSDNPAVATVGAYDGTVTAKGAGETVIKAYVGGYTGTVIAECAVQVGYKITVQKDGNGSITNKNGCYYSGSTVNLTAAADKGYLFKGWYANDKLLSTANPYSYKVTGDATVTAKFAEDPAAPQKNTQGYFEIKTNRHLVWAAENPNEKYALKNNITADGSFTGFEEFSGTFDGKGYTITNFNTDKGFFGTVTGTVKNLTLKNAAFTTGTGKYAGLLAGKAKGATIENCKVQGSLDVKGDDYTAGGLVAYVYDGTVIKNCSADVTVSIDESKYGDFGGLAGNANDSHFSRCSAKVTTEITFNRGYNVIFFGGLLGRAAFDEISCCRAEIDADITILRSQNLGIGGFIGYNNSDFENCYSTGSLKVNIPQNNGYNESGIHVGGMLGKNEGEVAKCYSAVDINLSGDASVKIGHVAGFCGNNEETIVYSLYCGHFTASGSVTSCTKPFTYTTSNGDTDNVYYVRDWYFEQSSSINGTVSSGSLNKQFFIALEFWDNVWTYDSDTALPHF